MRTVSVLAFAVVLGACVGSAWSPCESDADCLACARCLPTAFSGLSMCQSDPSWRGSTCEPRMTGEYGDPCASNDQCHPALVCSRCDPRCETCNDSGGVCTFAGLSFCVPDVTSCDDDFVVTCNPCGTAYVADPEPCPFGCSNGRCIERRCEPDVERQCDGSTVVVCNPSGSGFDFERTCEYGCHQRGPDAFCRGGVCRPGVDQRCEGDDLMRCTDDGAGWQLLGTCEHGCIADESARCARRPNP